MSTNKRKKYYYSKPKGNGRKSQNRQNKPIEKKTRVPAALTSVLESVPIPQNQNIKGGYWYSWDTRNDYPYKIIQLSKDNGLHKRIVKNRYFRLFKAGITIEGDSNSMALYAANTPQRLTEAIRLIAYDYILFNGVSFLTRKSRGRKLSYIIHRYMSGIRASTQLDLSVISAPPLQYFFSNNWLRRGWQENHIYTYDAYGTNSEDFDTMYYWTENEGQREIYPTPLYSGALEEIIIDNQISNFNLNNLVGGFSGDFHINVPNEELSQKQKDDFVDSIQTEYKGTSGRKIVVTFIEPDERSGNVPKMESLTRKLADKELIELTSANYSKIIVAHQLPSLSVVGMAMPTGFSDSGIERAQAVEQYEVETLRPMRRTIEDQINTILRKSGWDFTIKINDPDIEKDNQVNQL